MSDALLDRYIPNPEVREQHEVIVNAPAEITYYAAREIDLMRSLIVRAIFEAREWIMNSTKHKDNAPGSFLSRLLALGWGVLAEEPGQEIVLGSVTQPWKSDVEFHAIPPDEFADFHEPGYAKIAWTLAVEPRGASASVFRTETRVVTTDSKSRKRFRIYWTLVSPGILLIRRMALQLVRREAERRFHEAKHGEHLHGLI
jgi:hypothetical protein